MPSPTANAEQNPEREEKPTSTRENNGKEKPREKADQHRRENDPQQPASPAHPQQREKPRRETEHRPPDG
jgi:hypothetical protein